MTIVKNHKEYEIKGGRYFVEMYADKPHFMWLWRYSVYESNGNETYARIIGDSLLCRPNIKKRFA